MADTQKGQEIARKITILSVTGGPKKWFGKLMATAKLDEATGNATVADASIPLMAVYGEATMATHGASDFGEWTKLHGQFRAVNLDTGEIHTAPAVMLPPHVSYALEGGLKMADAGVRFAFEIHAKYDPSVATKYTYSVYDKMPPTAANPLADLEKLLGIGQAPALAAPAATQAPTMAPAPAGRRK